MKAVILEDELLIANHLKIALEKYGINEVILCKNIPTAENTLLSPPDFYVLDIRIGGNITTIKFAEKLNKAKIPFFFITANDEKATLLEATKTNPVSYFSKPFKEKDIEAIVELIKLRLVERKKLLINDYRGKIEIYEDTIIYCQADGAYTKIITTEKEYTQRITLKEFHDKLDLKNFQRVHKSYILNINKVKSKSKDEFYLENVTIPLSRQYKKELKIKED